MFTARNRQGIGLYADQGNSFKHFFFSPAKNLSPMAGHHNPGLSQRGMKPTVSHCWRLLVIPKLPTSVAKTFSDVITRAPTKYILIHSHFRIVNLHANLAVSDGALYSELEKLAEVIRW